MHEAPAEEAAAPDHKEGVPEYEPAGGDAVRADGATPKAGHNLLVRKSAVCPMGCTSADQFGSNDATFFVQRAQTLRSVATFSKALSGFTL